MTGTPLGTLSHTALFHRGQAEYLRGVGDFVSAGVAAGEAVLVAVPAEKIELLRDRLGAAAPAVVFVDMAEVGANPARIIPACRDFLDAHPGTRTRVVGELMWPGRTAASTSQSLGHEALVNLAFADSAISALCPYDTATLDDAVLRDARRTHPHLRTAAGPGPSADYDLTAFLVGSQSRPAPHASAEPLCRIAAADDLIALRDAVARRAIAAGLSARRREEFLIAVGEVATNGLVHTDHGAQVSCGLDVDEGSLVVEVATTGQLHDPMLGRVLRPTPTGGRGLWIVNQLCDLVELYSGPWGTVIRLHARVADGAPTAGRAPARGY